MLDHIDATDFGVDEDIIIGVGINTGVAAIGYAGTQQRVELTALGYNVNVAHALQLLARPNRLYVSGEQKFHAYEVLRQAQRTPKVTEL